MKVEKKIMLERGRQLLKNIEDYEEMIECVEHGDISANWDGKVVWFEEDIFREIILAQLKKDLDLEYKRLLKMAIEGISTMPCNNDTHIPESCYICVKHGKCPYADSFKWCKADEALKLIGEANEEPRTFTETE